MIKIYGHDKHEHVHIIPIWIGTTNDHLEPPSSELIGDNDIELIHPKSDNLAQQPHELPPFEVVTYEEPPWVAQLHHDVYKGTKYG